MKKILSLVEFQRDFPAYCNAATEKSGKSDSYTSAIIYLIQFLGIKQFDEDAYNLVIAKESDIGNKQSVFYKQFLQELNLQHHPSYLRDGYVRAAFPYLKKFWASLCQDKVEAKSNGGTIMPHPILQQIFFGAPGTGKSYKVDEIVKKADAIECKNAFCNSDVSKHDHFAETLSKQEKFGCDIWAIDSREILEQKLKDVDSDNNVTHPEHSALQAYIKFLDNNKLAQHTFRTTFHPDYDYAQFVGSYKPKKDKDNPKLITYEFVPQVFAKAYVAAWNMFKAAGNVSNAGNQVYLVIEEINRGNCAQIFGDIFQLLDRDDDGYSRYEIDADADFGEWLKSRLDSAPTNLRIVRQQVANNSVSPSAQNDEGKGDPGSVAGMTSGTLKLPPNFNILATMNTSDQSLFPMDSAFKRRFDWEYVPIRYVKDDACGKDWNADQFNIELKSQKYENVNWLHFLQRINADIGAITDSEDKQMGEFFIKPKGSDNIIKFEDFRSKVLFYLWDSVYKDEVDQKSFFAPDGKKITFQSLFEEKSCVEKIEKMLEYLDNDDERFKDCPKILTKKQ